MLFSGTMKVILLTLLFSLSALAQDSRGSTWVRNQWSDKLTGDTVVGFQLSPKADDSGRRPYIGITCNRAGTEVRTSGDSTERNKVVIATTMG